MGAIIKKWSIIFSIIMTFVSMILAIVAYAEVKGYTDDLLGITANWKKDPIVAMTFSNTLPCPNGFTLMENIGSWPGTVTYCNCTTAISVNGTIPSSSRSSCSNTQTQARCSQVAPVSAISLDKWQGKYVCTQRGGMSAASRPATTSSGSCSSGYHACGKTSDPNLVSCQPNSLASCPYSAMTQSQASIPADGSVSFTSSPYPTSSLYYNLSSGLPVVDLAMTMGSPCQIGTPGWPRSDQQPNLATFSGSGCSIADTRFNQFAVASEQSLFSGNSVPSLYISSFSANVMWRLSYRNEIYWRLSCPFTRDQVISNSGLVAATTAAELALLIINIIFGIVLGCVFPCIEWKNIDKGATEDKCKNPRSFLKGFSKIGQIAALAAALSFAVRVSGFYGQLAKDPCSDALSNTTFDFLGTHLGKIASTNGGNIAVDAIQIIVLIVTYIRETMKKKGQTSPADVEMQPHYNEAPN